MSEAKYTPEQQVQRAYEIHRIKNVMGRHAWYHCWRQHPKEYESIWSKRDDISWGNSGGYHYGREAFYDCYVRNQAEGNETEPGVLFMHTLTTGLVELAEDGQTAQGMWITPGQAGGGDGTIGFMYERYAVDFILEDGEWKIWHLLVGTDFMLPMGGTLADAKGPGGPPPGDDTPKPGVLKLRNYQSTDLGWPNYPQWPKPYKTFSETVSYGPESFLEKEAN